MIMHLTQNVAESQNEPAVMGLSCFNAKSKTPMPVGVCGITVGYPKLTVARSYARCKTEPRSSALMEQPEIKLQARRYSGGNKSRPRSLPLCARTLADLGRMRCKRFCVVPRAKLLPLSLRFLILLEQKRQNILHNSNTGFSAAAQDSVAVNRAGLLALWLVMLNA